MKCEKFLELATYFGKSKGNYIRLSFEQIEAILGQKLCSSAYKYTAYWHPSKTHTITATWIDSGYKLSGIDLVNQTVSFVKVD